MVMERPKKLYGFWLEQKYSFMANQSKICLKQADRIVNAFVQKSGVPSVKQRN